MRIRDVGYPDDELILPLVSLHGYNAGGSGSSLPSTTAPSRMRQLGVEGAYLCSVADLRGAAYKAMKYSLRQSVGRSTL